MRIQPPRTKRDEERILPLINVVFLLLIFFMLAGRLAAPDPFGIAPPASSSGTPAQKQKIVVFAAQDGRIALDGEMIDEAELKAAVAKRMKATGASELYLRADGRASATRVVAIMETLREAGVERLRLLTVPRGR